MYARSQLATLITVLGLALHPLTAWAQDAPAPVRPVFEGVTLDPATGTYEARFGYLNENDDVVDIPVGVNNQFSPAPADRGQTTRFLPGRHRNAFSVDLNPVSTLVWTLAGPDGSRRTATALATTGIQKLSPVLESGRLEAIYAEGKLVFLATFGYDNPNAFSVQIPIGPGNRFDGPRSDLGQPVTFRPGRRMHVFTIELQPGETRVWTLDGQTATVAAPAPDESIDPVGSPIPDPRDTVPEVVDPSVENISDNYDELDPTEQDLIEEVYFIETQEQADGSQQLLTVDLEFQFSSMANRDDVLRILTEALGLQPDQIIPNGDQYKLTLRLTNEQAELVKDDEALALIDSRLVLGEDRLIEIVQLHPKPFTNTGLVTSQGDTAQRSARGRRGWDVSGAGKVIGILSDSYDNLGGAAGGRSTGDLPERVRVFKDYPGIDEGRAMAEIIYDVAPGIDSMLFHTAFVSEGDFAQGIEALTEAGSDIIVDDVTYPVAPWFEDGPVSRAVSEAVSEGVIYITSAGNFAANALEGVFTPATARPDGLPFPAGLELHAIDGATDVLQDVQLDSGLHVLALQWDNSFTTDGGTGATDDLDIYILNQDGTIRAGKQNNNLGTDPWEFLAFRSEAPVDRASIVVTRKAGSTANLRFKYILFRTPGVEFLKTNTLDQAGASTVIGHADNTDALSVAAAPYFERTRIEPFSSLGSGSKPDLTAVDGGNTTFFGSDFDNDLLPNFFGTSAAAPHLAGLVALLSEGFDSLALQPLTPAAARATLQATALDIGSPGFDNRSGHGLAQADAALLSLGNPRPELRQLDLRDKDPLEPDFELGLIGDFFVDGQTRVRIGQDTLLPNTVTDTLLTIRVDTALGSLPIQAINPAIANSLQDGGASEVITARDESFVVDVRLEDAVTTYLQGRPRPVYTFTATPTVLAEDNVLTAEDSIRVHALLDNPEAYATPYRDTSSIGFYELAFEPGDLDTLRPIGFTNSRPALIIVEPLPVTVRVNDLAVKEGEPIRERLEFAFEADFTNIDIVEKDDLLHAIREAYEAELSDAMIVANFARAIVNHPDAPLDPDLLGQTSVLISQTALNGRQSLGNGEFIVRADSANVVALATNPDTITVAANVARAIVNGLRLFNPELEVAIDIDDDGDPDTNLARAIVNLARAIVNGAEITDGEGLINIARAIVNGDTPQEEGLLNIARAIVNVTDNPDSEALSNFARAIVNEGLVDEPGSLLNLARAIVNTDEPSPEALNNFARAIVNLARAIVNLNARAIVNFNARAIVNGQTFAESDPVFAMVALADTAQISPVGGMAPQEIAFVSIPMVTGLTPGEHVILPGSVVLTNLLARAIVNSPETGQGTFDIPLGNFAFTTRSGTLTVEPERSGPGIEAFVWEDLDGDDRQDPDEPGLAGVTVRLFTPFAETKVRSLQTDASGTVFFHDLDDLYIRWGFLKFEAVAGYARVRRNRGKDDTLDSDANRLGFTQGFWIPPNTRITRWDAGYRRRSKNRVPLGFRDEATEDPLQPEAFLLYPNPVVDLLTIALPASVEGPGAIRVLDALGRSVRQVEQTFVAGETARLDFSSLEKGVYFIEIAWNDQTRYFQILKN